MIDAQRQAECCRLIDEGRLSQREIARQVGVSRSTVGAIASGRRPRDLSQSPQRGERPPARGPRIRCPMCGAAVYAPCHACRIRRLIVGGRFAAAGPGEEEHQQEPPLTVELRDEEPARYLEIRRRKERELLGQFEGAAAAEADPRDELEPTDAELRELEDEINGGEARR